ncbi:MAG: ATP-dependent DNA helicase RecG [Candidatus Delongbacteria bacterium]|nr:ATP-dependent DNA helicase RecG [Candidatus Delongbacteria bacterium]
MNLNDSIQYLKGIGPQRAASLTEIGIHSIGDFLSYFPRKYVDRSTILPISHLPLNQEVTCIARIIQIKTVPVGKKRLTVTVADNTGTIRCIFFNRIPFFQKYFQVGQILFLSGKVTFYNGKQWIHPEYQIIGENSDIAQLSRIIPIYPWSKDLEKGQLSQSMFRKIIYQLLFEQELDYRETLPEWLMQEGGFMPLQDAIRQMHFPESMDQLEKARHRLMFEEGFYLQLLLKIRYQANQRRPGIRFNPSQGLLRNLLNKLPFSLTQAQKRVIREIYQDMTAPHQMNRLLQGDVGSGKTIVALLAMLLAYENGYQAVLMAPTEILAEQHYHNIRHYAQAFDIEPWLLTSGMKSKSKLEAISQMASVTPAIIIGTHALIQDPIQFSRLGLVVIDEQHRFGVIQRGILPSRGEFPDILIMTATPIPRTLAMSVYGDMDVSVLDELPTGRKSIISRWLLQHQMPEIYDFVDQQIHLGTQIYFVYPLIEESEKSDLKAAQIAYQEIQQRFPSSQTALLHGKMKTEQKNQIMADFKSNRIQILVSTTVIEVGVDVPNATTMIIEHAERFGLAQLHQLRGRVGRGTRQSYCFFVSSPRLTQEGKQRLSVITQQLDGFKIAEEDLKLRGPGELLGIQQAGLPPIKMIEILTDQELMQFCRQKVLQILSRDSHLLLAENRLIRDELFARFQDKIQFLDIG